MDQVKEILGWCTVINFGLLLWWFLLFLFARGLVYELHSRWFPMPEERFVAIHYSAMAFFKLLVIVFNLTPYLALVIIG